MSADRVSYTLDSTLETVNNAEETAGRMAASIGDAVIDHGRHNSSSAICRAPRR